MADVEIKFEREGLDGIVAVGTYVIDAMKRLGLRMEGSCVIADGVHFCAVEITEGAERLSALTAEEIEYFEKNGQVPYERLACQAIIEKAGEVAVMTKQKKETEEPEAQGKSDDYRKAFEELPLEKKIANLVQLEAIALGETVSFIANSPFLVFEKIGDVMAEFGFKLEKEAKKAARPKEHAEKNSSADSNTKKSDRKKSSDGE